MVCLLAVSADPAAGEGIHAIQLTGRDKGVVGEIPFQSHNQKVVSNAKGIFITHGRRKNRIGLQLQRSTDGGRTFKTVYQDKLAVAPPTIETDRDNNIYLIYPETGQRRTRFLKFSAHSGYTRPVVSRSYNGVYSAAKFASVCDPRGRLYHATQWGHLLVIDTSGKLLADRHVFKGGGGAGPSYPHLFLDRSGVLHFAMTTADAEDKIPYESIRYLKSPDTGKTWYAMDGKRVSTPTTCAADGPSTMINLPDELKHATWLANMHVKNGKVHFMYLARIPGKERQHYMRFDGRTGTREIDSWSTWNNRFGGKKLKIHSICGMFASDPARRWGPLFAVGANGRKLAALVSTDNGSTWREHAESRDVGKVWAEGGARAVTRDGQVIGTLATAKPQWATTQFFRFPVRPPPKKPSLGSGRPKPTGKSSTRSLSPDLQLTLAKLLLAKKQKHKAIAVLESIVKDHPKSKAAEAARKLLDRER